MNKTTRPLWQRWKQFWQRWARPQASVNSDALRDMYRKGKEKGIEIGRSQLYACPYFPKETDPGLYVCPMYRTEPVMQAVQPIILTKPGELARYYHRSLVERGKPPSNETLKYRTIKLSKEQYDEQVG